MSVTDHDPPGDGVGVGVGEGDGDGEEIAYGTGDREGPVPVGSREDVESLLGIDLEAVRRG